MVEGGGLEQLYDELRTAIIQGRIPPGTRMSQVQLAGELGVSRTPLREAIRLLQREGLIAAERNRMVTVTELSVDDLEAIYVMRILNETFAASVTVPGMDDEDVAALDGLLATMDASSAEDLQAWGAAHREFHRGLMAGAGARLRRFTDELWDHSERYRQLYLRQPSIWEIGASEHAAILDACRERDADLVASRLARHLARHVMTLMLLIAPDREPALVRRAVRSVVRGDGVDAAFPSL
jgi:DNA-binding GntR family transcriptional regulator